jgi:hypothetical protein
LLLLCDPSLFPKVEALEEGGEKRDMFGSCLARAAWILGIAIGALGLAFAVGAWVAYLVSSSYDERFADERDPVVSVDA